MLLSVACATPPVSPLSEPKAQPPVAEAAHSDRFKQGTQRVVDSAQPPDWLTRGAGCSLGQMTAMEQGQATVVPAHLCVGDQLTLIDHQDVITDRLHLAEKMG